MENDKLCNTCGRSFRTTTSNPSCFAQDTYCGCKQKACIRKKQPDCEPTAVIPAITVETSAGIANLANCFVHVIDINTTFYVDEMHRPMLIWAGNVEVDLPENVNTEEEWMEFIRSFNLRGQFLYVKYSQNEGEERTVFSSFYFDKTGTPYFSGEFEPIGEA